MSIKKITRLMVSATGAALLTTNIAMAQDGDAPARDLNQLLALLCKLARPEATGALADGA